MAKGIEQLEARFNKMTRAHMENMSSFQGGRASWRRLSTFVQLSSNARLIGDCQRDLFVESTFLPWRQCHRAALHRPNGCSVDSGITLSQAGFSCVSWRCGHRMEGQEVPFPSRNSWTILTSCKAWSLLKLLSQEPFVTEPRKASNSHQMRDNKGTLELSRRKMLWKLYYSLKIWSRPSPYPQRTPIQRTKMSETDKEIIVSRFSVVLRC